MPPREYCVYIMTNITNNVLYTGVIGNLKQRVHQHKHGQGGQFTRKYYANKLVYFEVTNEVSAALAREKQIKAGSRQKKLDLLNAFNPEGIAALNRGHEHHVSTRF